MRLVSGQLSLTPAFESEVTHAVVSEPLVPARPGTTTGGGWNKTRIDGSVRPAQAVSDAFRDPFGDRFAQRPGPTFPTQQPAPAAPSFDPAAPAPAAPPEFNPAQPAPPPTQPAPQPFAPEPAAPAQPAPENTIPENPVRPAEPPLEFQPPSRERTAPLQPGGDRSRSPLAAPSGAQIYNELDCGKTGASCQEFVRRLMADKLATISLDITPRYMPNLDPNEDQAKRDDDLKLSQSRDWKDAGGQVLATGRLLRLENGDAVIGGDSGEPSRVPLQQLGDDEICFVAGWYRLPAECILRDSRKDISLLRDNRQWLASTYTWHASALCHKPLYFEQVQLERYGHTAGPFKQPLISGVHFFGSLALIPYQMAISPPWECEYALGYYRPGSCAPWHIPPFPFSPKAALTQAGVVVGGIMVVP